MLLKIKGAKILSFEGKDIYIANNYGDKSGIDIRDKNGELNFYKFKADYDFSLDYEKAKKLHERKYPNRPFEVKDGDTAYNRWLINVNFNYSVRAFNKTGKYILGNKAYPIWSKLGEEVYCQEIEDGVCIRNGELVGLVDGYEPKEPVPEELLLPNFKYEDGIYKPRYINTIKTTKQIREELYRDGFMCGRIKYVRWKRSPGAARNGKCMFIEEGIYKAIRKWDLAGIKIEENDSVDLAGIEAYMSLTSSSLIGRLKIRPENILIIDDFESKFTDDVISVEEHDGWLTAERKECKICNSIWDGQSLIDKSLMGEYANKGMVLLRNRFFKSCCFNSNIQQWFKDHNITEVKQLKGFTIAESIKDIKMITTPSSIKYLKFGTKRKWLKVISEDEDSMNFGVVKYEKPPKYMGGEMVHTHYQLLNSLRLTEDEIKELVSPTLKFIWNVKTDSAYLLKRVRFSAEQIDGIDRTPAAVKNDVIYKLMCLNSQFRKTKIYADFRDDLVSSMYEELLRGKLCVEGNYSTLCGNPIEMLQYATNLFKRAAEPPKAQVYCKRFEWGKKLLGSRSPHITMSNVLLTTNIYNAEVDRYINATNEIVIVNSIKENLLQRLAGCDFDSDTMMLTDNEILIRAAERDNKRFKVAVCNVGGVKTERKYNYKDLADMDDKTGRNLIGEVINLSQELNTLIWHNLKSGCALKEIQPIYKDVCKLSILSGICIDMAKREFVIDPEKELNAIRTKYFSDGDIEKPMFFKLITAKKGYAECRRGYKKYDTSMDYLNDFVSKTRRSRRLSGVQKGIIPLSEIIDNSQYNSRQTDYYAIKRMLEIASQHGKNIIHIMVSEYHSSRSVKDSNLLYTFNEEVRAAAREISKFDINPSTAIKALKAVEDPKNAQFRMVILCVLLNHPSGKFYDIVRRSDRGTEYLHKDENGEEEILGKKFARKTVKNA